jgi:HK97 family phage major capsid protein
VRPYGPRQFPVRPYEEGDQPAGYLDPTEWSADVCDLFYAESALIRLGARLVTSDCDTSVLAVEPLEGAPQYGKPFAKTDPEKSKTPANLSRWAEKKRADVSRSVLSPDHELAFRVAVPDHLARCVAEDAELAWALKQDIAHALTHAADRAFLSGAANQNGPIGISTMAAVAEYTPPGDLLAIARGILSELRLAPRVRFGNAGWILHPATLDGLTRIVTVNALEAAEQGRSLDSRGAPQLLAMDGHDGGTFLGYPFVVSTAARDAKNTRIFFSADWSEVWIAVDRAPVTIDISVDAAFPRDETVIRAVMRHDIALRRPAFFRYAERPNQPEAAAPAPKPNEQGAEEGHA